MTLYSTGWGTDAMELERFIPDLVRPRVLLVEDDPANAEYAIEALTMLHCEVELVPDGGLAVSRTLDEEFDLVLMDSRIPSFCGAEAVRQIRRAEFEGSRRPTPIVMVTAGVMKSEISDYIRAGANDVLAKPYSLLALARTVRAWASPHQDDLR